MIENLRPRPAETPRVAGRAKTKPALPAWLKSETAVLLALLALCVLTWLPRLRGPIDLRWDGGVYYILGTSLAEGKGYRLLSEPGEIEAVQYPPLLPAVVAAHQLMLGTDDPTQVGRWLRLSAFLAFTAYIYFAYKFLKEHLPPRYAFAATLLCLFGPHVYFLSDLCFPETLFGLVTVLFVSCVGREEGRAHSASAYLFAVLSYALRTVGMAAFAAWVLESLVRRRFKQALWRAALALIPVLCWQSYVASVEASRAYNHPAYAYQRAPYMFYNVSYARNVSLRDPFTPEEGAVSPAEVVRRFVRNAIHIPASLGETFSLPRIFYGHWSPAPSGDAGVTRSHIRWSIYLFFLYSGGLLMLGGLTLQLLRRRWIVPLYCFTYLAALCLTPFPGQFLRYLAPIAPFLALSLIVFLSAAGDAPRRFLPSWRPTRGARLVTVVLSVFLAAELFHFYFVMTQMHPRVSYLDRNYRPVEYRLFYYDVSWRDFEAAIDHVRRRAKQDDVVAASMPHLVHLRTGLKAVMPPFETDAATAQRLLDGVPVSYFIVGRDVLGSERYSLPVVRQFAADWEETYSAPEGYWVVYRRVNR